METVHKNKFLHRFTGTPLVEYKMKALGSIQHAKELDKRMDQLEPGLHPCPFCGSPAYVRTVWAYSAPGIKVECSRCHCGTNLYLQGFHLVKQEHITIEQAMDKAVNSWQKRTGGKTA